jgi:hypothetical protein
MRIREQFARIQKTTAQTKRPLCKGMLLQNGVPGMKICGTVACDYFPSFLWSSFSVTTNSLRASKLEMERAEDIESP